MRLFANVVRAGVENNAADAISQLAIDPTHDDLAESQELNEAMIDLDDGATELELRDEVLERTVDVSEALECLAETYSGFLSRGGMTKGEAGLAHQHHSYLMSQVGMVPNKRAGVESYSSEGADLHATRAGIESLVEDAKKIWEKIVQWIKNGIARIVEFFRNLFGTSDRMMRRAEALIGKLEGQYKEHKFVSEDFKGKDGLAARLFYENNAKGGPAAAAGTLKVLDSFHKDWERTFDPGFREITKVLDFDPDCDLPQIKPSNMQELTYVLGGNKTPEGCAVYATDPIPGGVKLSVTFPRKAGKLGNKEDREAFKHIEFELVGDLGNAKGKPVGALDWKECLETTKSVRLIAKSVNEFKRSTDRAVKTKEALAAACKVLGKAIHASDGRINGAISELNDHHGKDTIKDVAEFREISRFLKHVAGHMPIIVDNSVVYITSLSLKAGKALLDQVDLCISKAKAPGANK